MTHLGRYTQLHDQEEVKDLQPGMDFREPRYRREVFLRFYEYHLKYRSHPGAVYYVMPYLIEEFNYGVEQRLWLAFINGVSQNIITSYLIVKEFPDPSKLDTYAEMSRLSTWFRRNYERFGWDTDRRYVKNSLESCIKSYIKNLAGRSQEEFFNTLGGGLDRYQTFERAWSYVTKNFYSFGRLATFSYLEYLRIVGWEIDCNNLFLEDLSGSKSHRNGLCKVLGRDDLDWVDTNPGFPGYDKETIRWLKEEGALLLKEAKERIDHKDVSYFTLESTLCNYKSWHRPNRRYPNVYNDMFHDRIKYAEQKWGYAYDFQPFWEARKKFLPPALRLEDNSKDPGLSKMKQNHYRLTGQVIMIDDPVFKNDFNDAVMA